jgi:hypothetical protein
MRLMIWLRRLLAGVVTFTLLAAVVFTVVLAYTYHYISTEPVADPSVPLLAHLQTAGPAQATTPPWQQAADMHRRSPVDLNAFARPPLRFGPWTRWWWPGNLVTQTELQREMQLFADVGLAGIEIQPFAIGLTQTDLASPGWTEAGWDSPAFYKNLHAVMHSARRLGMEVDLNNGSGWPSGGPHVAIEDGLRQLVHSELFVSGPRSHSAQLPAPTMPLATFAAGAVGMLGQTPMQVFAPDRRQLVAVTAARVITNERSWQPWNFLDQVTLDPESIRDLSHAVDNNQLNWEVPEGDWVVTALWQMPGGELIAGGYAHPNPGYVVDHLDAERMRANQDYLFRSGTGLSQYFGDPLRAFFNDSLEFRQERHFARGHLDEFEQRRGYDPKPWMSALPEPGRDQMPFHALNIATAAEYDLGEPGQRFLEDWQSVTSDLFRERYFETLASWGAERGFAHRLQGYGGPVDIIRAAGESDIPEAEQLYAGGSEMFLKAVSSGAYIAGKPIVSAESFIFVGRAFMTTPVKIKALADKAFAAGITQLIYHGTAYQLADHAERGYPLADGWYPWQLGMLSMDYSERWAFWPHASKLNRYIARNQYLLRKGEPETDVLVLYPDMGFPQGYSNPAEPFDQGRFPGEQLALPDREEAAGRGVQWMRAAWHSTRELEQQGLHWAWINEHALASATTENGVLTAGALKARALLLHNINAMSPKVAEHVARLAAAGVPVKIIGDLPQRQRGMDVENSGDARVRAALSSLASTTALPRAPVQFNNTVVKSIRRRLTDGGLLQFFSNPTDQSVTVHLTLSEHWRTTLWLDAWSGTTIRLDGSADDRADDRPDKIAQSALSLTLPAYGSGTLWLSQKEPAQGGLSKSPGSQMRETAITQWTLEAAGGTFLHSGSLPGDWLEIPLLRNSGEPGLYTASKKLEHSEVDAIAAGHRFELQLSALFGAAQIFVNGQHQGNALVPPYSVDITDALQFGDNELRVVLTPARKNRIIREIAGGDQGWDAPDLGNHKTPVSAGLIGPVKLVERAPVLPL